jgi:hypoxanthine phosphoribosyltransferase
MTQGKATGDFEGWPSLAAEIERVIWDEETIRRRVWELGAEIARDYRAQLGDDLRGNPPLVIGVFRGAIVFLADLIRAMPIPLECDYVQLYSYGKGSEAGEIQLLRDLGTPVAGRHVLLVEDIVDTGQTLQFLCEHLEARGAAGLKICALIDKKPRRRVNIPLDYVGFQLEEDAFVVGYGLDYAERYRNLPYVAALRPDAIHMESP